MISMTYARNLLAGHGLQWARQGAPVEGFTHPLWLLAMLPANLPFIPLRLRALPVQALSLFLLVLLGWSVQRLLVRRFDVGSASWLPAVLLTAAFYPLDYWSLMGMETGLQALLLVVGVDLALGITEHGEDRHRALWAVCAAAYLLRMDQLVAVAVVQAWVLWRGGVRTLRARSWRQGLAGFLLAAGGYSLFRWLYFHDVLPNTYYLKLTGVPLAVRLARGLMTFGGFAAREWPLLAVVGLGVAWAARRERRLLLPAMLALALFAYDVWIGGDAWEASVQGIGVIANRFVAPAMPLVFLLLGVLLELVRRAWMERQRPSPAAVRWPSLAVAALVTLLGVTVADGLAFGPDVASHWSQVGLLDTPPNVERAHGVAESLHRFEQLLAPGAVVATAWAGVPAFFSDYRMVDILGYNDRHVARLPSAVPLDARHWWRYVPGHVKWDERRLLTEQRPDAFFQIWGVRQLGKPHGVLKRAGYRIARRFWFRADTKYLLPAGVEALSTAHRPRPARVFLPTTGPA